MFALDGKPSNISENDIQRRNAIAKLLEEWGLVKILNPSVIEEVTSNQNHFIQRKRWLGIDSKI